MSCTIPYRFIRRPLGSQTKEVMAILKRKGKDYLVSEREVYQAECANVLSLTGEATWENILVKERFTLKLLDRTIEISI